MKTRVRPKHESCLYDWEIEVYDPYSEAWISNSEHKYFWYANWKAKRLAKQKLEIFMGKKELFVERIKNGNEGTEDVGSGV